MKTVFERHPKATLVGVWLGFVLAFTVAAEMALKHFTGLGRPVLFYSHPSYGYRLKPNQETWRFGGAHFKINNLGLRARDDWTRGPERKILFLGDSVTYGGNHISNEQLFSEVAVRGLGGLVSGNAGIPNWGVENVHALIVQEKFLPAQAYVSTFIENDFYRGLQLGQNMPWIKYERPYFALHELAEFLWYKFIRNPRESNQRARESEPAETRVSRAAAKLRAMDELIKTHGYAHLVFISPTRDQVLGEAKLDARVREHLARQGLEAVYLLERPIMQAASLEERRSWFKDDVHLTAKGHAVWGELMREHLLQHLPARAMRAGG